MTITNSIYQLISLFEDRRRRGHHIEHVQDGAAEGWHDLDTCERLLTSLADIESFLGTQPEFEYTHEDRSNVLRRLCRCEKGLFDSCRQALRTPENRRRLFTASSGGCCRA